MPADRPAARLAGPRARRRAEPQPGTILVASPYRAAQLAEAGHLVCVASPDALPFGDQSLGRVSVDRDLPRNWLPDVVVQCARALAAAGSLELEVHVRYGATGSGRWLAAALSGSPPPGPPEAVARLLLGAGFDRITQRLAGSLAVFHARRLPGRPAVDPTPPGHAPTRSGPRGNQRTGSMVGY